MASIEAMLFTNLLEFYIMKISTGTLSVLNFSSINQALLVKKGDVLETISPQNIIVAEAVVSESFPQEFAIYDLNKLINVESLFEEPEFSFQKRNLQITSGNRSVNYVYADPTSIHSMPDGLKDKLKALADKATIKFDLSENDLESIKKCSQIMDFENFAIVGNGENISLVAGGKKGEGNFVISLDAETDDTFKAVFDINHLKLLPGDYSVSVSDKGLGHFKNEAVDVQYWITVQRELSRFGE